MISPKNIKTAQKLKTFRFSSQFMRFCATIPPQKKTWVVEIYSKNGDELGIIKWFPSFRKYSFFPNPQTVFENECIGVIKELLENMMKARRLNDF